MKGMDFGTGKIHGAGNSPVKILGTIASALGKAATFAGKKIVGKAGMQAAAKAGKTLAGKSLAKAAGKVIGKKALQGAGQLAKKAAVDSFAQHQEAKNRVPSNAPTVQF